MRMSKKKEIVPKFRFPEFQRDGIDFVHGNKLFKSITNKNHNSDLPILAITQDQGAVPRDQIEYNVTVSVKIRFYRSILIKSLKHTNTEKKMTKNIPAEFLWRKSRKMDIT